MNKDKVQRALDIQGRLKYLEIHLPQAQEVLTRDDIIGGHAGAVIETEKGIIFKTEIPFKTFLAIAQTARDDMEAEIKALEEEFEAL